MMTVPQLSQLDPKWSSFPLGDTTIGARGCTLTSLAMAMNNWAINLTPPEVVAAMVKAGGIESDGSLLWTAIPKAFPGVHFHWRQYTTLDSPIYANRKDVYAAIVQIKELLALGQPVLLNIRKDPQHWVLAVDWSISANDFIIHDPDGGHRMLLTDKYDIASLCLYGYGVLIGDPMAFPDQVDESILKRISESAGAGVWKAAQIQDGNSVGTYAKELVDTLI